MPRWRFVVIAGTPVYISAAWLAFAAIVVAFYAPVIARHGTTWPVSLALGAGIAVLWAISVLLHELGHLVIARLMGTEVIQIEIGLTGGLTDTVTDDERPSEQFWVSLAGPLVSLALGLPGLVSLLTGRGLDFDTHGNLGLIIATFTLSNLVVGVFNLLPGLPLDGGHILVAAVWRVSGSQARGVRVAAMVGLFFAVATSVGGLVVLVTMRDSWATASVALLLAWGFWDMANTSLKHSRSATRLERTTVADLVRPAPVADARDTVATVLERSGEATRTILIDAAGTPIAVVETEALVRVPTIARTALRGLDVATPLPSRQVVSAGASLLDLVSRNRSGRHPYAVVVDADGTVMGLVTRQDAARLDLAGSPDDRDPDVTDGGRPKESSRGVQ